MNKVRITLACTALLTAGANANLIINGSFEDATVDPGGTWIPMNAGNTTITGWTVFGSGIDYLGTFIAASDGQRTIDLNRLNSGGGIAQTFATNIGWNYTVEFDLSANMFGGPIKLMSVDVAGQSAEFEFDYAGLGATAADPMWQRISWSFIANDTSSTLSFTGLNSGVYGAAIDHVVVTGAVPTPGALAAFAAVGTFAARRRRG